MAMAPQLEQALFLSCNSTRHVRNSFGLLPFVYSALFINLEIVVEFKRETG